MKPQGDGLAWHGVYFRGRHFLHDKGVRCWATELSDQPLDWLTLNRHPSTSGIWFMAVGMAASATHMVVFAGSRHVMVAELANAAGFVVAFGVSFLGHRWLSFQDTTVALRQSLLRFAGTALAGFACNEAVFMLLHRWLDWPGLWALGAALVIAAGQTFLLSRFWAFRR